MWTMAVVNVCNVATEPGETDGFTVADHIRALEQHVGPDFFQHILHTEAVCVF